jgi:hypothetical protein
LGLSEQNKDPDALGDRAVLLKIGPARPASQALEHSNVPTTHPIGALGQIAGATSQKPFGTEQIGNAREQMRFATGQIRLDREQIRFATAHCRFARSHRFHAPPVSKSIDAP